MRRDKRSGPPPPDPNGILQMRAQLPIEPEFVDIFRKFKLSFNLLVCCGSPLQSSATVTATVFLQAKLKNHIHEPNAPELLHFLFTPLTVILEACHWGLGRNIAPQVCVVKTGRTMVIPPFEASLNIDRVAVAISGGSRVDAKLPDQQGVGRVDEPWRDLENTSVSATLVTLNVKRGFTH